MAFQKFSMWIRGVLSKMLHSSNVKNALGVNIAISSEMQTALKLWSDMFQEKAPWLNKNTQSMGLPAAITGEIARLVTVELQKDITGSARAEFLKTAFNRATADLRISVEKAAAGGGIIFKPYVDGRGNIAVDRVPAWRFAPTSFNDFEQITGAVFIEQVQKGSKYFNRLEHHQLDNSGYKIRNLAFCAHTSGDLGEQCSLNAVEEWAALEPELVITQKDGMTLDNVLFAYFKIPYANTIDDQSPLGVSAYSRATGLIEEADKQYSRILWEYEGSELAIDASEGALKLEKNNKLKIPTRKERLFRELGLDHGQSGDLYEVFSPTIRDTALFNGLDKLLKRIEFNCNLAYGTLSDPQNVDKTAEEIRSSKQRSYSAVREIQSSLQTALEHLVWAMDQYATLYNLAPKGNYEITLTWGDGILEDSDKELAQMLDMASRGFLRPEVVIAKYFNISEEEARDKYMPNKKADLTFEE